MKKIVIDGQHQLTGNIKISGAKNSAVALIPAAIVSDEGASIYNIPNISDTSTLIEIIKILGGEVTEDKDSLHINNLHMKNEIIPEEYAKKLRASYYFMGALLTKYKKAKVYFPGGCNIGARPIDFHLKGFEQMGARVDCEDDYYIISAPHLKGADIYLDFASVGATINLMLAALKASGETIINNAAKEPEIVNVATFLNNMGADIRGAGTSVIRIRGVDYLKKAVIDVIPDRIEAGTYLIIGSLIGKELLIENIIPQHISSLIAKLHEAGVNMRLTENSVCVSASTNLKPIDVKSTVYPGFPTDLGQPMCVFMSQCQKLSTFEENVWENRFGHVEHLNNMGANIEIKGKKLFINGKSELTGCPVIATDLRAGAALVIAGLIAKGVTTICEVEHILRGYEGIVEKLASVGAKIKIVE